MLYWSDLIKLGIKLILKIQRKKITNSNLEFLILRPSLLSNHENLRLKTISKCKFVIPKMKSSQIQPKLTPKIHLATRCLFKNCRVRSGFAVYSYFSNWCN